MDADKLIGKQIYYFYEKHKNKDTEVVRGRFLGIHHNPVYSYLIKTKFDYAIRKNILVYSPLEWYTKAETLDDVFKNTRLPTDVVKIIEEFV